MILIKYGADFNKINMFEVDKNVKENKETQKTIKILMDYGLDKEKIYEIFVYHTDRIYDKESIF